MTYISLEFIAVVMSRFLIESAGDGQGCENQFELFSERKYLDTPFLNHNRDISSWKPILVPGS